MRLQALCGLASICQDWHGFECLHDFAWIAYLRDCINSRTDASAEPGFIVRRQCVELER